MTTFTRQTNTVDETTGITTPTITTIDGAALQVRGTPSTYARLGLSEMDAPTLVFTPTNYNLRAQTDDFVKPGDTTVWANQTYRTIDVSVTAPDGFVVTSRIVVQRA